MALKGLVGAVYENDTAPVFDNIVLLFDWKLEVEHRKGFTYGPELHGVLTGWYVMAQAYWTAEPVPEGPAFIRLFIGKGDDIRCLTGQVKPPALQKTDGICEKEIILQGIGPIRQEG